MCFALGSEVGVYVPRFSNALEEDERLAVLVAVYWGWWRVRMEVMRRGRMWAKVMRVRVR